jgi:response regulator RpfG family c-di-GMP phosphodiesterase
MPLAPPTKRDLGPPVDEEFLKELIAEGQISDHELRAAHTLAQRRRMFIEEVLIQTGCLSEANLLRIQANFYKTQFLSTQKLASASIDKALLKMVPQKLAERFTIFPILYDAKKGVLKVLTVHPGDLEMIKNVQFAARVNDVQELIARPAAIQAAIDKHYQGNGNAFFDIREPDSRHQQAESQEQLMQQYEQRMMSSSAISIPASIDPKYPSSPESSGPSVKHSRKPSSPRSSSGAKGLSVKSLNSDLSNMRVRSGSPKPEPLLSRPPSGKSTPASASVRDYIDTINVLVALIENGREGLRNHSALVARICRQVCDRLGIRTADSDAIVIAAFVHDLGKPAKYHLTALNAAQSPEHQQHAHKSYLTPVRLFEAARLPPVTVDVITHLYERFDGNGFPDRLAGKDIELGARLLAIVETHADLVANPQNAFGKKLSPQESYETLAKYQGKVFDPSLVDIFRSTVSGEDLRAKLIAGSRRALIVDPDPEETMMLELRLVDQGFDVTIARGFREVDALVKANEFDVVISEVDLQPRNGFELLKKLRTEVHLEVPFVFVTKESDGAMVKRGFELGAADYITKPASPELVALKIRQVLDGSNRNKKSRGVSGSLEEMALPDVVQVLYHSRKSGKLLITSGANKGEVSFSEGQICDASFGAMRHEEAFYEMLSLSSGHFELDPDFRPTECVIEMSPESLLLEGMRRLDERNR